ncbi:hypothetical protein EIN_377450 [Entamoeba invadens IP1]|uniref:Uncharacterized protein n=1 Tax=Entamoeba invadens IP1 TaxID=370355 RepID=A0A0A1TU89_ENTIV|nr:hypothetical protein EIN_377450 [Entamoeba invadens IP1]ELP83500.1 hypothetical protein EIN_377450 [Entamoeba invadens IP1]|eukprot:XP_004182846.1 hypothetical protein EIN_377450 [Entamoeba invadens IP1]
MAFQISDLNDAVMKQLKSMKNDDRLIILNISNNGTLNVQDLPIYRSNTHIIVFVNPTDQDISIVDQNPQETPKHISRVRKQVEHFSSLSSITEEKKKSSVVPKQMHRVSVRKLDSQQIPHPEVADHFIQSTLLALEKAVNKSFRPVMETKDGYNPQVLYDKIEKKQALFMFKYAENKIIGSFHEKVPQFKKFTSDANHFTFVATDTDIKLFKINKKVPTLKIGTKDFVDTNCAYQVDTDGKLSVNACMDRYYADMVITPPEIVGSVYPSKVDILSYAAFVCD